ncbi:tumor necrosis factor receptor superfamily member 18 isoform X1 [Pseudophryne corroboree]|uniref:tumor necrosis factor receptor superfamily member 18 isoform X1 n=1 Tax=Pseudophryne corroboree TaxID=495146 RepID=UPI003081DE11
MGLTWKVVLMLGVWYVMLMDGTARFVTEEFCENGYLLHTKEGTICCQRCQQANRNQPCRTLRKECYCDQGRRCLTKSCTLCTPVPNCLKGQQLKREVNPNSLYEYVCEECPEGTFSVVENGICMPGEPPFISTEYSRDIFKTSVPGNQTDGKALTPPINRTESIFNNYPTIVICSALAVFILLLITIFIHLLIGRMKAKPSKMAGFPLPSEMIVTMSTKEDADSWSCQYPEEEHGDHTTEKCDC